MADDHSGDDATGSLVPTRVDPGGAAREVASPPLPLPAAVADVHLERDAGADRMPRYALATQVASPAAVDNSSWEGSPTSPVLERSHEAAERTMTNKDKKKDKKKNKKKDKKARYQASYAPPGPRDLSSPLRAADLSWDAPHSIAVTTPSLPAAHVPPLANTTKKKKEKKKQKKEKKTMTTTEKDTAKRKKAKRKAKRKAKKEAKRPSEVGYLYEPSTEEIVACMTDRHLAAVVAQSTDAALVAACRREADRRRSTARHGGGAGGLSPRPAMGFAHKF